MSKENATRLYIHFVATNQQEKASAYAEKYPHVLEDSPPSEEPEEEKPKKNKKSK
tara:strand:+ start:1186 stop:1350 length:165 start_codon:yes stop_codon:yes gene_type:complete